jgi:predicted RNA-binding protein with PIN domain
MAKRLCGSLKNKISLVFDGYPAVGEITMKAANMDLLFSRSDTADESIKRIVERSSNPKNVVVVSDDKEIRFCVKPLGAKAKSIEEFMQPLNKSKSKAQDKESLKKELTYSQIDSINKELEKRWLKYF